MLKRLFIPHHGNDYKPHLLHHKRVWFYGIFLALLKVIIIATVLLAPEQAWLSDDALARQANNITTLTNELRLKNNLSVLAVNTILDNSANLKAEDMNANNYFSHTDKLGRGLDYYLKQVDYKYNFAGENLAVGYIDAKTVVKAWQKSPTHYANIIDKDFKELGISIVSGQYQGKSASFIVSHFGSPAGKTVAGSMSPLARGGEAEGVGASVAGVKIPTPGIFQTALDKYFAAKTTFSDWFGGEFQFANSIYYIFFGIFAFALFTTIFIEIKRQHPHLIINGMGILVLIFFLIKI
ncbi:MAG: hypothetical protein A3J93_00105 [Candidatus Magasanikbacteria bacterium RIFOXYC2_FULL_42_28]|uniref:SCP domain-containing protein n=1 Tax=Candidatus Magasanikbacteria bacterium RIFOXYC2_FULL_42_28 TaxID=1798704 RepID=A0A1F6NW06_9BACT|nr:MAG: hypothetical protein A3J93_00105 [Candidatus Magasanikbacteria bacterium RIFOXYC2_FULL_42_28]